MGGQAMGRVLVAIDCSGSVSQEEKAAAWAELMAIRQDCNPAVIDVMYFDSTVSAHDTFTSEEDPRMREQVRTGGTAFSPIFRDAENLESPPVCCVVLTDLICYDFGPEPGYPVLWITTSATEAPWGEVVEMDPRA
jgi:predicted metal-dependent peptidase